MHSGIVHTINDEIKLEFAGLTIKYNFKSDEISKKSRYSATKDDDGLIIEIYNFSDPLGEGIIKPLEIGTIGEAKLFITWFLYSHPSGRRFDYTLMTLKD